MNVHVEIECEITIQNSIPPLENTFTNIESNFIRPSFSIVICRISYDNNLFNEKTAFIRVTEHMIE